MTQALPRCWLNNDHTNFICNLQKSDGICENDKWQIRRLHSNLAGLSSTYGWKKCCWHMSGTPIWQQLSLLVTARIDCSSHKFHTSGRISEARCLLQHRTHPCRAYIITCTFSSINSWFIVNFIFISLHIDATIFLFSGSQIQQAYLESLVSVAGTIKQI